MRRYEVRIALRRTFWMARWWRRRRGGLSVEMTSRSRREWWVTFLAPYRWRAFHRWYAARMRYFWLPCPLCGHEFGAHEWRDIGGKLSTVPDPLGGSSQSIGICPRCTRAGRGVDIAWAAGGDPTEDHAATETG